MFSLRRLRSFAWGCLTVSIFTMGILFALSVVLGASISDVHRSLPTALLADNPGPSSDTDTDGSNVGDANEPPLAVTIEFQLPDEAAESTVAASAKVSATPSTLLVSASSTPTLVDQDLDLALPSQGNVGNAGVNLNLPALTATAAAQLQGTKVQAYVKAVAATRTASVLQAAPTRRSLTATAAAWQP